MLPIIMSFPGLLVIAFAYRHACLDLGKIPHLEYKTRISLRLGDNVSMMHSFSSL